MNTNKRRWKQTADEAMAPVHFPGERDRLSLEIGAQIAGLPSTADATLGTLQGRILGFVEDSWIRASLAARCLDILHDSLETADYEDVRSLQQEILWTESYLASALNGFVTRREAGSGSYADRLCKVLAAHIAPRLEIEPAARAS